MSLPTFFNWNRNRQTSLSIFFHWNKIKNTLPDLATFNYDQVCDYFGFPLTKILERDDDFMHF